MTDWYDRYAFENRNPSLQPERIDGPLKVYQRDRLIGTVPSYPVRSTSGIFDVRPGDFTLADRDGEKVLNASNMIGPGDFACLEGWKPAEGVPDSYADKSSAERFDQLASAGGSKAAAMGALIEEMLSGQKG